MFPPNTLFIIGAGASEELGLPLGYKLKADIASRLSISCDDFGRYDGSGDRNLFAALKQRAEKDISGHGNIIPYLDAGRSIAESMPLAGSIDSFIYTHHGNEKIELCAKLAIVQCILEAERNSSLFIDHTQHGSRLDFRKLDKAWHCNFVEFFADGCRKEDLEEKIKNVSFIVFNYDRCLEQFLYHSLPIYFGVDDSIAAKLVHSLNIFHPYGQVGSLPWQDGEGTVPFGSVAQPVTLLSLTRQIKTYTESIGSVSAESMKKLVQDAELVVFLGNAFHQQNMDLLKPASPGKSKRIFATATGLSDDDVEAATVQVYNLFSAEKYKPTIARKYDMGVKLDRNLTCYGLFQNYRKKMTYTPD